MALSKYFKIKKNRFPIVLCDNSTNHKTFVYLDEKTYPKKPVDDHDALLLIDKAKRSFSSGYSKVTNYDVDKDYFNIEMSIDQIKTHFFVSKNDKYYCIYFNMSDDDAVLYYNFGIIERSTGKHLMIIREYWSGLYDALFIKHDMYDYYSGDNYLEKTCLFEHPTKLSEDSNEEINEYSNPTDIINLLKDYFMTLHEELSELKSLQI